MRMHAWKVIGSRRCFRRMGLTLFCGLGVVAGLRSGAQEAAQAAVAAQKATTSPAELFSADLEALSQRLGVAFVAEGQPFPGITKSPVPSLRKDLSPEAAVREVTDYFDYAAVRQGNIYLLTKRYTNPEDLPEVSPEECRIGIKAIAGMLAAFNPKYPPGTFAGDPIANIARMLSPAQMEKLGKEGLPVTELNPEQHAEIERLALKFYIQDKADRVAKAYALLESRNPADPTFHWQTIMDFHAFGYDTRSERLNKILFIPVSNGNHIIVSPDGTTIKITAGVHTENGVVVHDPDLDPTDPTVVSEPMKQFLGNRGKPAHAVSLAEAVSALTRRAANKTEYRVDPMYATKHVTLVGTDKLAEEALLRSFAAVYGLRVVQSEAHRFDLTRPLVTDARQLSDLNRALLSAIPGSISHAFLSNPHRGPKGTDLSKLEGFPAEALARMPLDYTKHSEDMALAAMRMFRYVAEAEVKAQPSEKIRLSKLGERARTLFEFAQTVNLYAEACTMANRPAPEFVTDLDHATLTGGISHNADGTERFALSFSFRDPQTGEVHQRGGFANAIIPR